MNASSLIELQAWLWTLCPAGQLRWMVKRATQYKKSNALYRECVKSKTLRTAFTAYNKWINYDLLPTFQEIMYSLLSCVEKTLQLCLQHTGENVILTHSGYFRIARGGVWQRSRATDKSFVQQQCSSSPCLRSSPEQPRRRMNQPSPSKLWMNTD